MEEGREGKMEERRGERMGGTERQREVYIEGGLRRMWMGGGETAEGERSTCTSHLPVVASAEM